METQNLLLEIGTEEIPAGYIPPAESQIKQFAIDWLGERKINHDQITSFGTPRRLTLYVPALSEKQETEEKLFLGPPARIAYDEHGNLTKAGLGFAKSQNVDPAKLIKKSTDKGDYLAVLKKIGGDKTVDLLPAFCTELISSITFPKTMYWEKTQFRFARPIRWILALYGTKTIPIEIADVKSGNTTLGHPIRSKKKITIKNANLEEYQEKLRQEFVIVDPWERGNIIQEQIANYGTIDKDPELLQTVTYLVESPSVIQGDFHPEHLELPSEILITSMKHHQKYFPVISNDGKLQSHFLSIHNSSKAAEKHIKAGNERVLKARLSDAQFFWKEDTKTSLLEKNKKLSGLLFQAKLGNYDKKVERIIASVEFLSRELLFSETEIQNAKRAAELCKADLVTEMVKEFPELQGTVGKYYALHDKENPFVSQAIQDHYLPKGTDSALPENKIGAVVSVCDKLDSIVGCFGVGLIPTGSEDPFALRRAGNGIIRIILANPEWTFSIKRLLNKSADLYQSTVNINPNPTLEQVIDFLAQRLRASLIESGIRYDTADAVLIQSFDDINDTVRRAEALQKMRTLDGFIPLTVAFKRVINILKQARDKFSQQSFGSPDTVKFTEESEKILNTEIQKVTQSIQQAVKEKRYIDALQTIASLRPHVDLFFDKVMVMVEDSTIRNNRLALLEQLETQFRQLADFSQLVVEES